MAYDYMYPNYQQNYQPYPQGYQTPQIQPTGILYVDGDKGAEDFQMLPNTFAFLKSTDGKAVYFKQALANGNTTCDKFIWSEMAGPKEAGYITREEFDEFVKSLKPERRTKNEQ